MKLRYVGVAASLAILGSLEAPVCAQNITEGFNDITTLSGSGWVLKNNSTNNATALSSWFQGNDITSDPVNGVFDAYEGPTNSYIAANFQNTPGTGTTGIGTISNWLITPTVTFSPGGTVSFWTRTTDTQLYADRLQIRFSAGAGSDVGTTTTSVGTFTTLLGDINSGLSATGYPSGWTNFTYTLPSNVSTTGRIALRYFVTNGGPQGDNSDYIGIDSFKVTAAGSATPAPGAVLTSIMGMAPLASMALRRRRARK